MEPGSHDVSMMQQQQQQQQYVIPENQHLMHEMYKIRDTVDNVLSQMEEKRKCTSPLPNELDNFCIHVETESYPSHSTSPTDTPVLISFSCKKKR